MRLLTFLLIACLAGSLFAQTTQPSTQPERRWEKQIERFEAQDRERPPAPGGVLFVGSSTIVHWNIADSFPDLPTSKRGFGGSKLSDSLYYADRIILPYQPRVIVLYAGENDLAGGVPPEAILADLQQLVDKIAAALPDTKLVVIGMKTSPARIRVAHKMRDANRRMQDLLSQHPNTVFVDLDTPLLGPDGQPRPEFFKDRLHLSAEGYAVLNRLIRPHLPDAAPATQPTRQDG